ncbi:hypothetical protein JTE90_010720 [Oedothorax gibbosus]|uniref:Uncharacterized protein n=1 Tax=Oedothorax gibbosus TaxID=931172 RepID=A0AAV6UNW1_9ARAC|nr:hypothetical protein JTE90_010720 [Oedothorax gibbosus]
MYQLSLTVYKKEKGMYKLMLTPSPQSNVSSPHNFLNPSSNTWPFGPTEISADGFPSTLLSRHASASSGSDKLA